MDTNQWTVMIFGILYFGFILFTRKRGNFEEFSVAGRSLGFFLIFSSICASYIGPGWTLGLAREGYVNGMFLSYIVPFCGLGLLLVGVFFVPKIRAKFDDIYSMGDLVGGRKSHNHRIVRLITGIVSLLFMGALTVAMSYAGGELLNHVFGFSKIVSIVIVTSVVIAYSYFGGIRATIKTDALQFVHFIILIPILALLLVNNDEFSWQANTGKTVEAFDSQPITLIIGLALLWFMSATGLDSPGLGRFLASKTDRIARNAAIAAGCFMAIWFVLMVFIGSAGQFLYPDLANNDQLLLNIAAHNFPGILNGIFIIAMIGVIMSSQDTVLNSGSVLFSEDIVGNITQLNPQKKLIVAKSYTLIMGLICILIASYMSSILGVIMSVTEFYIPVMIPVIVFSIIKQKCYWQSAIAAMGTGLIANLFWEYLKFDLLTNMMAALILGTAAYLISDAFISAKIRSPSADTL